jgi:hypothetical protein
MRVLPARIVARSEGKEQRTSLRFDTQGRLTGHLVSSNRPLTIGNFGLGGFSAHADGPVAAGSHIVQLVTPDRKSTLLEARNVYCQPVRQADGRSRFAAGFEFVRPPQDIDSALRGILQQVTQLRLGMMWV